jgi:hypothetical protein
MARFKYMGEKTSIFASYTTNKIGVNTLRGALRMIAPPGGAPSFVVGADIGVDIVDPFEIMQLSTDPRFQKI